MSKLAFEQLEQRNLLTTYSISPGQSIQDKLDIAEPGDILWLAAGEHREDLRTRGHGTPDKPITITGSAEAVLRGAGAGRLFEVSHDYYVIENFTIDGLHGDPDKMSGYSDKLIYAIGKQPYDGVEGLRVLNMTLKNSGGEAVRFRYYAANNEVAYSTFTDIGVYDNVFNDGGKNGEAVYIGTSSTQWGKNPTSDPDLSRNNLIHHNSIDTQGNEGVDIKEGATGNIVEYNTVTGQLDAKSAGLNSRGNGNIFRHNELFGNAGAGVRLGGHQVDGVQYGVDNEVYGNSIHDNQQGGVKVMAWPNVAHDNIFGDNKIGDFVGKFAVQFMEDQVDRTTITVTASSFSAKRGRVPENVLDGDLGARWSAKGDGEWIQFDFGREVHLTQVQIAFYKGHRRIQTFDLQYWDAGANIWRYASEPLQRSSGDTKGLQLFEFDPLTTTTFRIVGHGNSRTNWNSLTEVAFPELATTLD